MTWSLRLKNGDIEKNGSQLAKVKHESKAIQDLRSQLLYKMGINDLHPEYGSLLNGGVTPEGTVHESLIGTDDKEAAKLLIRSEINRIIGDYQNTQFARAKRDKMAYGKATLTRREAIVGISNITVDDSLDSIYIKITLVTGSKELNTIELTVSD